MKRRAVIALRAAVATASAALLIASFHGWSSLVATDGDFRVVQAGGAWYAFDRGESPAVDGQHPGTGFTPSGPNDTLRQRNERPRYREPTSGPVTEVFGRVHIEHGALVMGRHWYVPWLATVEPEITIYDSAIDGSDGTITRIPIQPQDLEPAMPAIAAYLDAHAPGRNFTADLSRGLAGKITFARDQWPVLACQIVLLGVLVAALVLPRPRPARTQDAGPA